MHPYRQFPSRAFWSRSVSSGYDASALVSSDAPLVSHGELVVSAGSCFASNLVPYLEEKGLTYLRTETRHSAFADLPGENLGYDKFSAAYGNLYTTRQLLQLLRRCLGQFTPKEDRWFTDAGVIDPFRPGLRYHATSEREFDLLQGQHLAAVRRAFGEANVFIFTLGLTEAWVSQQDGAVFPACPGTVAGTFDADKHTFQNFEAHEVADDLSSFIQELRVINPGVRFILTVSPVPLIATASGDHVLLASTYSKAVLRVAAQKVAKANSNTVYFPAFEIVTGPQAGPDSFETDKRNVTRSAVDTVMAAFLAHCALADAPTPNATSAAVEASEQRTRSAMALSQHIADAECEEAMAERD